MKNHYETLGIKKKSTKEQIKKAYRKIVLEYHPDKTLRRDSSLFKEVTIAYKELSNNNKRKLYDKMISENNYNDSWDPFLDKTVNINSFNKFFSQVSRENIPNKGSDIYIKNFDKKETNIKYQRKVKCSYCKGYKKDCQICQGKGIVDKEENLHIEVPKTFVKKIFEIKGKGNEGKYHIGSLLIKL